MTGGALSLRGLVKAYDDARAVDGLSLEIAGGEFFSFLGESGCGKTTTLRMIAGFEHPDEGEILLDGADLTHTSAHQRPVNTVFQSYALFPFLTVRDNVAFGLKYTSATSAETASRVGAALELVEMGGLAKRKPHQLSGGQQQRVALARALVLEPRVLLLDEPLGALDARLRKQLQRELRIVQQRVETTFVYVTHDQDEALTMSDRLAVIVGGQVEQVGTPSEVYARPATPYVASFLGTANLYDAHAVRSEPADDGGSRVDCRVGTLQLVASADGAPRAGDQVRLMVRPERVTVTPGPSTASTTGAGPTTGSDNLLPATVTLLTFRGAHTSVALAADGITIDAEVANVHGAPPSWLVEGGHVCARIAPSALRVLGPG